MRRSHRCSSSGGALWQCNTVRQRKAVVTSRYVTPLKLFTGWVQVCSSQSVIENRCSARRTGTRPNGCRQLWWKINVDLSQLLWTANTIKRDAMFKNSEGSAHPPSDPPPPCFGIKTMLVFSWFLIYLWCFIISFPFFNHCTNCLRMALPQCCFCPAVSGNKMQLWAILPFIRSAI